jgi:hypothetical protein
MPTPLHLRLNSRHLPVGLSAGALLAAALRLWWEHLHGGIQTHHVMASAELPGLHNAWSVLVLPALAAWVGWRIHRRMAAGANATQVVAAGLLALLLGLAMSSAFVARLEDLTAGILMVTLLLALVLPGCRAECWLGFVLGMWVTFGAVIPAVVGGAMASVSALLHLWLKPVVQRRRRALRHG